MLEFLSLLRKRYQTILYHTEAASPLHLAATENLPSLVLSEAFIEKEQWTNGIDGFPVQIAVVGPTQSGKSSIVNLVLGQDIAEVSPLAGSTTFPQGFGLGIDDQHEAAVNGFFSRSQLNRTKDLEIDPSDNYSLTAIAETDPNQLTNCVIWDTPDFDSIQASNYYNSLLRTIAFADIILLVISKDKYADQSVWDLLSLIEPLKQPTIICLNKIQPDNGAMIVESFFEKWQQLRQDPRPPLMTCPFQPQASLSENCADLRQDLINHLQVGKSGAKRNNDQQVGTALLRHHWHHWTENIRQEHHRINEWNQLIDAACSSTIEIYQRHYLDHPQHFDTLKRALAELLTLLEIPGVAPILLKTRNLLTWPVRHLFDWGSKSSAKNGESESRETQVLERMFEHYTIQLSNKAMNKQATESDYADWWQELLALLSQNNRNLSENFRRSMLDYQENFQPEIENAARRLYVKLEQQPATLNSLRATRLTTDAAAVAIALKTGGIGVQDFVITPAVLALTSFLTESALGHYMGRIEVELKEKQLQAVESKLFNDGLNRELKSLPEKMKQTKQFNIPLQTLSKAEAELYPD